MGIATVCGTDGLQENQRERFHLVTCEQCITIIRQHWPRAARALEPEPTNIYGSTPGIGWV